jgi:hypothetical protein
MIGGLGVDNLNDVNDNAADVMIGDSSPLESDNDPGAVAPNFAVISANDVTLAAIFTNWQSTASVAAIQSSGLKATAADGSRDQLRGNQLTGNYIQNFAGNDLVRTTTTNDVVDLV